MRTINEQLADITEGKATVGQIVAEGVHSYAIQYYEPKAAEREAFFALQAAVEANTPVAAPRPMNITPERPAYTCPQCGGHQNSTLRGHCDDCEA